MEVFYNSLIASFIFTAVVLFLVWILNFAQSKVYSNSHCRVYVNEKDNYVESFVGDNLLSTLTKENILLPSACGGTGTCGACKCQINEGMIDILPTEKALLSRKEQQEHYRLACQIKVREDLHIKVPDEIFNIQKFECAVISNKNVSTFIKELVLKVPTNIDFQFEPGSYIQLYAPSGVIRFSDFIIDSNYTDQWDQDHLWQYVCESDEEVYRAYSMANYSKEKNMIILNVRIMPPPDNDPTLNPGIVSSYVFSLKQNDKVLISGPYGDFKIKDTQKEMVYIAGGAGMAPVRSHLMDLFYNQKTKRKVSFWYGARSKAEIFYEKEFEKIQTQFENFKFNIALSSPLKEDNWEGFTGFIHNAVYENYLKNHQFLEDLEYYMCGPPVMIDAVKEMLLSLGVCEENMIFDSFG